MDKARWWSSSFVGSLIACTAAACMAPMVVTKAATVARPEPGATGIGEIVSGDSVGERLAKANVVDLSGGADITDFITWTRYSDKQLCFSNDKWEFNSWSDDDRPSQNKMHGTEVSYLTSDGATGKRVGPTSSQVGDSLSVSWIERNQDPQTGLTEDKRVDDVITKSWFEFCFDLAKPAITPATKWVSFRWQSKNLFGNTGLYEYKFQFSR